MAAQHMPTARADIQQNRPVRVLEVDGVRFRDLDKDGVMAVYEDPRRPVQERVEDLLHRMTIEEKVGLLFHAPIAAGPDGGVVDEPNGLMPTVPTTPTITDRHIRHFNLCSPVASGPLAAWHNRLQHIAAGTRLGLPVLLSTDPRHSAVGNPLTSVPSGGFSSWPEPLGFGALADEDLVHEFGAIARQEYAAVGLRAALHPMADIASEPRWTRTAGTFGADPDTVGRLAGAYVQAFQGPELGPGSVACMVKHWPGAGPQADGLDAHFPSGPDQVYPAGRFDVHKAAFGPALKAGVTSVMPYYGKPVGLPEVREVGFSFNADVVAGMLRRDAGYDGIVCTDWGLVTDDVLATGAVWHARAWGVEHLDAHQRVALLFEAGVDQLGGETCTDIVLDLLAGGRLTVERIDESARRILRPLFALGIVDDPYVDERAAVRIAGRADFVAAGQAAQRRAMTLLTNRPGLGHERILPLPDGIRLYVEGIDPALAAAYGDVTDRPEDADVAIVRLAAPHEPADQLPEAFFHQGSLALPADERDRLVGVMTTVPTVVCLFLERAAVVPEIAEHAAAFVVDYAAEDLAVLDVVFGHATPEGRLPVELPRSMADVENHPEDLPGGFPDPLFALGHRLPTVNWRPRRIQPTCTG